jgi:hypothetical protein
MLKILAYVLFALILTALLAYAFPGRAAVAREFSWGSDNSPLAFFDML